METVLFPFWRWENRLPEVKQLSQGHSHSDTCKISSQVLGFQGYYRFNIKAHHFTYRETSNAKLESPFLCNQEEPLKVSEQGGWDLQSPWRTSMVWPCWAGRTGLGTPETDQFVGSYSQLVMLQWGSNPKGLVANWTFEMREKERSTYPRFWLSGIGGGWAEGRRGR